MFGFVFVAAAVLMAAGALTVAAIVLRRLLHMRTVIRTGVRTAGRCIRIHTSIDGHNGHVGTRRHHVIEYTGPDGHPLRFQSDAPGTVCEGDPVTVAYLPHRPDRLVLVRVDGRTGTAPALFAVAFLTGFAVVVLGVGVTGYGLSRQADIVFSGVTGSDDVPAGPSGPDQ